LNQRVSSALIAIPLALLVIILGRAYLAATLLVFGIMAVREFYDLAQFSGYGPLEQVGILGVRLTGPNRGCCPAEFLSRPLDSR
jgi:CDP-diglyceride synthetase